ATHSDLARMYHFARRYDEAIASFHKAMDLSPGNPYPNSYVSMSYLAAGKPDDAFAQWAPWVTRPGRPMAGIDFGPIYRKGGWSAVWPVVLDHLQTDARLRLRANLALGKMQNAFAELVRLEQQNDSWLLQLEDPVFDPMRNEPRFQALRKRLLYP